MLEQHLVCAALEHPLSLVHDEKYFGSGLNSAIITLKNKGYICSNPSVDSSTKIWSYIGQEVYWFYSMLRFENMISSA